MLSRLTELAYRKWVYVALVTVIGTLACQIVSLSLHFLLVGSEDIEAFRRGMLIASILPLLISTPLLLLLALRLHELSLVRQEYARELARDSLTSCLNGALFAAMVDTYPTLIGSRSGRRIGALLMVDVDHLSRINERFGHRAGDQALHLVAEIVRASVRSGDLVGRIGGDEFGVFLPGITRENAKKVAERIRSGIAETRFELGGSDWSLSVSVGVVLFEAEFDLDDLLRAAGHQMKAARESGGNRIEYTSLQYPSQSRPSLH